METLYQVWLDNTLEKSRQESSEGHTSQTTTQTPMLQLTQTIPNKGVVSSTLVRREMGVLRIPKKLLPKIVAPVKVAVPV